MWENKNVWKVSTDISIDIFIFRKEWINKNVESFDNFYFPTFIATNVIGKLP
jgi:hypothetical protein